MAVLLGADFQRRTLCNVNVDPANRDGSKHTHEHTHEEETHSHAHEHDEHHHHGHK